jgi:hypothetical protein
MDPMRYSVALIDSGLSRLRTIFTASLLEKVEGFIQSLTRIAVPVAGVLGALLLIIGAIRVDSLMLFLSSGAWLVLCALFYYVGSKLIRVGENTIRNNSFSIASQELLDVLAVFYASIAIVAVVGGFYTGVKLGSLIPLAIGLAVGLVNFYFVWLIVNPQLVSTFVRPSSTAGMDAIALLSLGNKCFLRFSKILYGLLPLASVFFFLRSLINAFGDNAAYQFSSIADIGIAFFMLAGGLLSPLIAYLIFIFAYMLLDVLRSILEMASRQAGAVPALPAEPLPAVSEPSVVASAGPEVEISPAALKKIIIGIVLIAIAGAVVTEGKQWYNEYREKAEMERRQKERRKAEEEAQRAADEKKAAVEKAEKDKRDAFLAKVRTHVGKPAQDLVLDTEISKRLRDIFGKRTGDFEAYFSESANVVEGNGLIVGSGCRKENCDTFKALTVVDTASAAVFAVVVARGKVLYFGIKEDEVPGDIKKWVLANSGS